MTKVKATIIALSVTLLSLCVIIALYIISGGHYPTNTEHIGHGSSHPVTEVVYDRPLHVVPTFFQTDPTWSSQPYLSGTIGSHGCGLVCASIACSYFTGEEVTPDMLLQQVGDTCSTDGVNDMLKFAEWMEASIGGLKLERAWTLDGVTSHIGEDVMVFAGLSGMLGQQMYSSHVVLLHDLTEHGATVKDPYDIANNRELTWQELDDSGFLYYVIVQRA